jgi:SSS family solute:Na+ symporter
MELGWIDWLIIVSYFGLMLWVGLRWRQRAGENVSEFFVSGRQLPWWLAGTSMVATTFAADTPLAVTGLVVQYGLAGNWFWWSMALGGMFTVFVFARYWRRAEILTDVEFIELRYAGPAAACLRAFRALYLVLIINPIIMGWVTSAMLKVAHYGLAQSPDSELPVGDWWLILGLLAAVGLYCAAAGMWGVAITDGVQFVLAMMGCIALAYCAVAQVGGIAALKRDLVERYGSEPLRFLPDFSKDNPWMPLSSFAIMVGVQWWASWYPGAEPGGGGFVVQRMAACRDERHARLATLWFQIAHYCLRPWPWLLVALVALILYPHLRADSTPDIGYVLVMRTVSPPGLRGLLLVTFFAAYMSTISTLVNWSASYLVCDIYQRFLRPHATQDELVRVGRIATLLVLVCGAVAAWFMRHVSVDNAWKFLTALGAGTGTVYIVRWFWWRINAWAEIAAMLGSLLGFVFLSWATPNTWRQEHLLAANAALTSLLWLTVVVLTPPEPRHVLVHFYRKIRPDGPGWTPIARLAPDVHPDRQLAASVLAALFGAGLVYSLLWTAGQVIFACWWQSLLGLMIAAVCAAGTWWFGLNTQPRLFL